MSVIGVYYGTKSGIIRRITVPDHPSELSNYIGPGESLEIMSFGRNKISTLGIKKRLAKKLKKTVPSGRCLVKHPDKGVVGEIHADPEIDAVDGHELELHPDQS